jgi:hypothetical protein
VAKNSLLAQLGNGAFRAGPERAYGGRTSLLSHSEGLPHRGSGFPLSPEFFYNLLESKATVSLRRLQPESGMRGATKVIQA